MNDGFLLVDKPSGMTSHDVVAAVRRVTRVKKVGHAGTLDPMATGLVVIALGRCTRLIRYIQDLPKDYEAVALFGVGTDTLDADGVETVRAPMSCTRADVEAVLAEFTGSIMQVPPMVSALKHDGRRLYDLAREGIEIERRPRPVEVYSLELISFEPGEFPLVGFRVVCGKGTYIRSLADDIAVRLGGRAHLVSLRRTRSGRLDLDEQGIGLEDLDAWQGRLISPADALRDLPAVATSEVRQVLTGRSIPVPDGVPEGVPIRILDGDGALLAVFRVNGAVALPEVVLG